MNAATIGRIGEQRVIEQILLSNPKLICYQPFNDEEGVDLIVRKRHGDASVMFQVKTVLEDLKEYKRFDLKIWEQDIANKPWMYLLMCILRKDTFELHDRLWVVPAREYFSNAIDSKSGNKRLEVYAGDKTDKFTACAEFRVDKMDIGTTIAKMLT